MGFMFENVTTTTNTNNNNLMLFIIIYLLYLDMYYMIWKLQKIIVKIR